MENSDFINVERLTKNSCKRSLLLEPMRQAWGGASPCPHMNGSTLVVW